MYYGVDGPAKPKPPSRMSRSDLIEVSGFSTAAVVELSTEALRAIVLQTLGSKPGRPRTRTSASASGASAPATPGPSSTQIAGKKVSPEGSPRGPHGDPLGEESLPKGLP